MVEKEYKNNPNDMDTITMWADLSSRGADARSSKRPLHTTSEAVISSFDAAKIRKDAETAIENDEKIKLHKVFHGYKVQKIEMLDETPNISNGTDGLNSELEASSQKTATIKAHWLSMVLLHRRMANAMLAPRMATPNS